MGPWKHQIIPSGARRFSWKGKCQAITRIMPLQLPFMSGKAWAISTATFSKHIDWATCHQLIEWSFTCWDDIQYVSTAALGLDLLFRDNIRLGWFLSSRDWFLRSHPIHARIGLYLLFLPWWCGRQGIGMVAPLGFRQSKACMNSAAPAHGTLMGCTWQHLGSRHFKWKCVLHLNAWSIKNPSKQLAEKLSR